MMNEVSVDSWLFVAAVATVLLSVLIRRRASSAKETGAKLPPGPWNLPVVGSLHHLVGAPPHRALHRLSRRHGPLMLLRVGEVPTVVVSSPEAAAEVLRTKDPAFASRPRGATLDVVGGGGRSLIFAPHGEYWRQMRKVCVHELLSATQVRRMESIRGAEVARLVDSIVVAASSSSSPAPAPAVDLGQALTELTNNIVARAVFGGIGCRRQQQQEYLRELGVMATLAGGFSLPDLFPSSRLLRRLSGAVRDLTRSRDRVQRIVGGVIQERREKRRSASAVEGLEDEDLLDVLLRLQEEDSLPFPLTEEIIGTVVSDVFGAATDTTATTLEWAMAELIRNPQAMARAKLEARQKLGQEGATIPSTADHGDLRYLQMVIKETLRLHPAAPLILRANQDDCTVMGYHIPKGSSVFVNIFSLTRDPRYWDYAEEFIPERFESSEKDWTHLEFVPFGAGRRQCPGALFAATTMELALASLLYHFDWTLPDGADPKKLDMGEVFGITVRRRSNLCLLPALDKAHLVS